MRNFKGDIFCILKFSQLGRCNICYLFVPRRWMDSLLDFYLRIKIKTKTIILRRLVQEQEHQPVVSIEAETVPVLGHPLLMMQDGIRVTRMDDRNKEIIWFLSSWLADLMINCLIFCGRSVMISIKWNKRNSSFISSVQRPGCSLKNLDFENQFVAVVAFTLVLCAVTWARGNGISDF